MVEHSQKIELARHKACSKIINYQKLYKHFRSKLMRSRRRLKYQTPCRCMHDPEFVRCDSFCFFWKILSALLISIYSFSLNRNVMTRNISNANMFCRKLCCQFFHPVCFATNLHQSIPHVYSLWLRMFYWHCFFSFSARKSFP